MNVVVYQQGNNGLLNCNECDQIMLSSHGNTVCLKLIFSFQKGRHVVSPVHMELLRIDMTFSMFN